MLAIPVWQGRVSPVFDVAKQLLLVAAADGVESARREARILETGAAARVALVCDLGVNTLICGAVSQPLKAILAANGVQVIDCICGDVDDVLQAYLTGTLADDRFAIPGSGTRRARPRPVELESESRA